MFLRLLERQIKKGILHLHLPGKTHTFGNNGEEVHWHLKSEKAIKRMALDPEFQVGQTYMEGFWLPGESTLYEILALLRRNFGIPESLSWLRPLQGALQQWNKVSRSYSNVAHHYDVDERVFRLFLDKEMFYSCAYFDSDDISLEDAQQHKARHISNKLLLRPGDRVLDIGCGWGSMMFYLAKHFDVRLDGITLSKEQFGVASKEARQRCYENINLHLQDYREHIGQYDRIVSIGMFEHVGTPYYNTFFKKVAQLLNEDGVALLHTIGKTGAPRTTNPWIHKYIFPGGVNPSLSQISKAVEQSGLMMTDIEILRLHYAKTIAHWLQRFLENRTEIARMLGEEFCRMWEFYLAACQVSFEYSDLVVYQLQLTRKHGIVPTTRDYLYSDRTRL